MQVFLFDLIATQPNIDGDFHGGGKYAKKIFFELLKRYAAGEWELLALFDSSKKLDGEIAANADRFGVNLVDILNDDLPSVVKRYNVTRFYSALPFSLVNHGFNELPGSSCEVYVTIHGLRSLEIGVPIEALKYLSSWKAKLRTLAQKLLEKRLYKRDKDRYHSLLKNTRVITVSNHTKFSVLSHFPDIKDNVNVFYSPDVTEFEDPTPDAALSNFDQSGYFLLVSGNRWLKNNLRSAKALDQLFSERPELPQRVIVTGVGDPGIYLRNIRNKDRFTFYKYVSESFLKQLYKNAFAFLYMTLNEGFGYPPLDAMKLGIPVITSPFTSIPEICGDAVLYSNPYSIPEIKNRILQLSSPTIYANLSSKGMERYAVIKDIQQSDLEAGVTYLLALQDQYSLKSEVQ